MRHGRDPIERIKDVAPRSLIGLFLSLSVLSPSHGAPAGSGSIRGRVADGSSGVPIPSIQVTLVPEAPPEAGPDLPAGAPGAPGVSRLAITDAEGEYAFDGVPPGVYRLIFEGVGHPPAARAGVRVAAGVEARVDHAPQAAPLTERILVRGVDGGLGGAGPSRARFTRRMLAGAPAALGDPFRALSGSAGIATENDLKAELRIRGGEASETAILVDGIPILYPYHFSGGAGSAATVSLDQVEEVEVLSGGFSVEHGDALAGVVELTSRDRRPEGPEGSVGVGTLAGQAAFSAPAGGGYWTLSGRRSHLGSYGQQVEEDVREIALHDLSGSLRLPLGRAGRLELWLVEAGNRYSQELGGTDRGDMRGRSGAARARVEVPLDGRTLLRVLVSHGRLEVGSGVTGGARYDQDQIRQDLRMSVWRLAGEGHRLTAGMSLERLRGGIAGTVSNGYSLVESALEGRARTAGIFIEDLHRPGERLALRYGLRADRSSATRETVLSPRASLEIEAPRGLVFRGAAGRFAQFPRREQIFLAAGEPLRRQIADHFILGLERRWTGGPRLVIEGYVKRLRDPIGESVNRSIDLPERMTRYDAGRTEGIELTLEGPGGSRCWLWRLDYGYMVSGQEKDGARFPRNTDQRHAAAARIGRRLGAGWDVTATLRYGSGLPYTPQEPWFDALDFGQRLGRLNSARLPACHRLDLRVGRVLPVPRGTLGFFVEILNVYDRDNVRRTDLVLDRSTGTFHRTTEFQIPFTPVFGLAAEF